MIAANPDNARANRLRMLASGWFVRSQDPTLPPHYRWLPPAICDRWNRWRSRSESAPTFDDIEALWRRVGEIPRPDTPDAAELAADRYDGSVSVAEWLSRQASERTADAVNRWKIAASFAVVVLTGLLAVMTKAILIDRAVQTEVGEWRTVQLTDGSTVQLGPRTQLRFRFGDDRRFVYLVGGEAYFEVSKDAARPFVVSAGAVDVRAVGTAFAVTRPNGRVIVTVREGSVTVSRAPVVASNRIQGEQIREAVSVNVSSGEQATVPGYGRIVTERVDLERELAWASCKLILGDGASVADAIEELNRRNRIQIVTDDPALASRPIRGVFDANDPESFAALLSYNAHLTVRRDAADVLRLVSDSMPERQSGAADAAEVPRE